MRHSRVRRPLIRRLVLLIPVAAVACGAVPAAAAADYHADRVPLAVAPGLHPTVIAADTGGKLVVGEGRGSGGAIAYGDPHAPGGLPLAPATFPRPASVAGLAFSGDGNLVATLDGGGADGVAAGDPGAAGPFDEASVAGTGPGAIVQASSGLWFVETAKDAVGFAEVDPPPLSRGLAQASPPPPSLSITDLVQLRAGAQPTGIAAGPGDSIWVTESGTDRIDRITPSGNADAPFTVRSFGAAAGVSPGAHPYDVVQGPDNAMWFTEPGIDAIGRLDLTSGTVTEYRNLPAGAYPLHLDLTATGVIIFTEAHGDALGAITPGTGAYTEYRNAVAIPPGSEPYDILTVGSDIYFTERGSDRLMDYNDRTPPAGTATFAARGRFAESEYGDVCGATAVLNGSATFNNGLHAVSYAYAVDGQPLASPSTGQAYLHIDPGFGEGEQHSVTFSATASDGQTVATTTQTVRFSHCEKLLGQRLSLGTTPSPVCVNQRSVLTLGGVHAGDDVSFGNARFAGNPTDAYNGIVTWHFGDGDARPFLVEGAKGRANVFLPDDETLTGPSTLAHTFGFLKRDTRFAFAGVNHKGWSMQLRPPTAVTVTVRDGDGNWGTNTFPITFTGPGQFTTQDATTNEFFQSNGVSENVIGVQVRAVVSAPTTSTAGCKGAAPVPATVGLEKAHFTPATPATPAAVTTTVTCPKTSALPCIGVTTVVPVTAAVRRTRAAGLRAAPAKAGRKSSAAKPKAKKAPVLAKTAVNVAPGDRMSIKLPLSSRLAKAYLKSPTTTGLLLTTTTNNGYGRLAAAKKTIMLPRRKAPKPKRQPR